MILLDFSKEFSFLEIEEISSNENWKNEIYSFIKNWFSESEFIISKTSGSTGIPKEIKIPKTAMKMSAEMTGKFFGLNQGNTALLCMPVSFIAGKMMIVRALELKLKLYCVEPKSKINLDFTDKIDFVPMTPMQVENSFDQLPKIKILLIGGAPLSDEFRNKLLPLKTQNFESYGMTETITHIALKKISEEFFTTLNGISIRKDERDCLVIQTPYFEEEITTNDIVEIKAEHQFKWLGRFDNVINSGGIKLFPEQIESKLKSFIKDELIISSLPDSTLGQKLILIIEDRNNSKFKIDKKSNLIFQNSKLDKYEVPKETYFLNEFPRTESGKIKRNEILDLIKKEN
ncbi:AMP-binding protein [Moheibacter sediminis]|uniref:O-succinylbenzoic acid--CoA ligase n=1 Tax=Moheibacter sediminis TaxID=1434700 RepID=A0A1W2CVB9_9FLAO|nr:AMP-binding protein [Moheibacter sediminis]SMC88668.1 O-succinylbenzoic acid--CoA ligase [Moheibacter sediminis]